MSSDSGKKVIRFVTGNKGKIKEVKKMLEGRSDIEIETLDYDMYEIQGEVEEITRKKCEMAVKYAGGGPVICEDTCLCFNALHSLPGPYIKSFLEKIGHEGLNKILEGYTDKSCYCICTFAFAENIGDVPLLFSGITNGHIVPARGRNNFGWDPIFQELDSGKTYAEMTQDEKNKVSHRSKALRKLVDFLGDKYKAQS